MKALQPSVLGFYKESPEPVEMTSPIYSDASGLYAHIPSHLRNRLEVVVGNRIEGRIDRIESAGGKTSEVQEDAVFEVKGYWHEMHLPDEIIRAHDIREGDHAWFTLLRIHRHGLLADV